MIRILLIGRGLSGKLAALYYSRHFPDAEIIIVDPAKEGLPVVGESTVEVTVQFLKALGLGEYLEEKHLHKYGLTYYFRLPEASGADTPEYIQHEAPGVIRLPSYNLNRFTFDEEIESRISPRVRTVVGRVQKVDLPADPDASCVVGVKDASGEMRTIEADFVIDCSGRARVLAKQLDLQKPAPYQRSSYWFRLAGFDRSILNRIKVAKRRHHCFDSYYVTHHFYGRGYWIWIIPMRSTTGEDMVSFGITYRPEIANEQQMDFERLCEILERDHPRLKLLITSGTKVDESRYYNYMYEARQYYDRSGKWFLLGDSGFTFDPANSAGIAYLGHQIPQIASIIKKKLNHSLTPCYVDALEMHLKAQLTLQDQWSNWYEVMDDPIKMAWTLLLANMGYFHLVVPNYMSGAYLNAGVARQVARLLPRFERGMQPPVYPFPRLLDALARTKDPNEIIRRASALYEYTVPFSYYRPDDIPRGRLVSRYFRKHGMLRFKALRLLNAHTRPKYWPLAFIQSLLAMADLAKAGAIAAVPRIYEKEHGTAANVISGFEPPYAFLFPLEKVSVRSRQESVSSTSCAMPVALESEIPEPLAARYALEDRAS